MIVQVDVCRLIVCADGLNVCKLIVWVQAEWMCMLIVCAPDCVWLCAG